MALELFTHTKMLRHFRYSLFNVFVFRSYFEERTVGSERLFDVRYGTLHINGTNERNDASCVNLLIQAEGKVNNNTRNSIFIICPSEM